MGDHWKMNCGEFILMLKNNERAHDVLVILYSFAAFLQGLLNTNAAENSEVLNVC